MIKMIENYIRVLKVRNVWVMSVVTFFYSLTFYTTTFTLFLKQRGLDYWEIFILESVLSASIFLFEVPSGYLADRIGRKKVITLAVLCYAISVWITAVSHHFWLFALESAIYGIGVAAMSGADTALVYDSLERRNARSLSDFAFSLTGGAATVAMVVSLPLGGWLSIYSLDLPVYVTCISLLLAFLIVFLLKEENTKTAKKHDDESVYKLFVRFVLQHRLIVLLQLFQSIAFTFIFGLMYLNQPIFLSYGIPIQLFGLIMLAINILSSMLTFISPWVKEKIGEKRILIMTTMVPGILFFGLSLNHSTMLGVILLGLILGLQSLKSPVYRTFLNNRIQDDHRATILSIISFTGSLVGMAAKPVVGWIADIDLHLYLTLSAFAMIIATCGSWIILNKILPYSRISLVLSHQIKGKE